jgi:WD40 repeat protein
VTTAGPARDPGALTSPFVGLTSYAQENAPFFFGRDAEQRVLISNLRASRLTLLYAQSGAGKSSVLRAGAAATLAGLARRSVEQRGSARHIPVVFSSWRDEPTGELMAEIEKAIAPFLPTPSPPGPARERLDGAIEAASNAAGATLLVMLDQFEEYFLYRPREAHDRRFAGELAACLNRAGLHANFLISIREDAYSGLGDLFQGRIRNVYSNYLHLEHLTRESAREAIEKPITTFNELHPAQAPVDIESGLADEILSQLGPDQFAPDQGGIGRLPSRNGSDLPGGEIAAPYLQLVMQRLWETETARGSRTLHRATLEELGGAQTIARTHVDHALDDLPEAAREAAVDIFHHLITPSGTKIALAASDLAEYTGRPAEQSTTLLERLARSDTRILRPVPPPPGHEGRTRYEISHDLLAPAILDWGRRQRAARLQREKESAEREKESAERQASLEKRRARMFRTLALGSAVLLILTIVALIAAVHNAASARRQHAIALSRQLAAESLNIDPTDPVTARRLAVAAWRLSPTAQAGAAMTTLLGEQEQNGILLADAPTPSGGVNGAVAFSPNGKLLAGASGAGSIWLWNPVTGQPVRVLHATFGVSGVAFSPHGTLLAGADAGGAVWLWNPVTGKRVRILAPEPRVSFGVTTAAVAFSPNGKLLASAAAGMTVQLWDPATGQAVRTLNVPVIKISPFVTDYVAGVAFSPGGKLLATADYDGTVRLWDLATGRMARVIHIPVLPGTGVLNVAFRPNGRLLASADGDGTVRLWDPATGHLIRVLHAASGINDVNSVAFSHDGRLLATAAGDGTMRLWNPDNGQALGAPLRVPISSPVILNDSGMIGVAFSPDGTLLASSNADGTVRLLNPATGHPVGASLHGPAAGVFSDVNDVAFSPDGELLASANADATMRLWDLTTGRLIRVRHTRASPLSNGVPRVAFSHDGRVLASANGDGTVGLWNRAGQPVRVLHVPGVAYGVAFSPDSRLLASVSGGGTVRLWDPASGRLIHVLRAAGGVYQVAFSPNGRLLAGAGYHSVAGGGTVWLWDPASGRLIHVLRAAGRVNQVAFSPHSGLLASVAGAGTVQWWDPASGRLIRAWHATNSLGLNWVAFSPNGRLLASVNGDGTIQLRNPVTGQPVGERFGLRNPGNGVNRVAFSPDGKLLASADRAGTVRFWKVSAFINPYAALCDDVGAPTRQEWKQYAGNEPQPSVCN